jgi:hypothetical protein
MTWRESSRADLHAAACQVHGGQKHAIKVPTTLPWGNHQSVDATCLWFLKGKLMQLRRILIPVNCPEGNMYTGDRLGCRLKMTFLVVKKDVRT